VTKLEEQLAAAERKRQELRERGYAQMQFRFIKLAKNGTPIAETDSDKYRHSYFLLTV
jgi:hypothetical protein